MPSKSTPAATAPPAPTFETAIERLERVVEEMESEQLPLEELLVRYEEGIGLVKTCQEKLEAAEKRIEIITRNAAGKPQLAAFAPGVTPPAAPAQKSAPPESPDENDVSLF